MRALNLWFTLVASGFLAACDPMGEAAQAPQDLVKARAEQRWQAMVAGEYEKAYEFLSPGFRSRVSAKEFRGRFEGRTEWTGADIQGVECEDDLCVATVVARFRFLGAHPFPPYDGETAEKENWIRSEGQWWHVPRR